MNNINPLMAEIIDIVRPPSLAEQAELERDHNGPIPDRALADLRARKAAEAEATPRERLETALRQCRTVETAAALELARLLTEHRKAETYGAPAATVAEYDRMVWQAEDEVIACINARRAVLREIEEMG